MKRMMRILPLVITDTVLVNIAVLFALLLRFEFNIYDIPHEIISNYVQLISLNTLMVVAVFACFRLYSSLWQYAGIKEAIMIMASGVVSAALYFMVGLAFKMPLPRSCYIIYCMVLIFLVAGSRFMYKALRYAKKNRIFPYEKKQPRAEWNIMLIGAGSAADMLLREISLNKYKHNSKAVCIIDDDATKTGKFLHGVKIIGTRANIEKAVVSYGIDEIIFAISSCSLDTKAEILNICKKTGCSLKTLPPVSELLDAGITSAQVKEIEISDLLGREPVSVNLESIIDYIAGKAVLVTGGGGSIGSELCRQIAAYEPKQLIVFDIYENNAYELQLELKRRFPKLELAVLIGSVRDSDRIEHIFEEYSPDIVYHAAAHKHVPLMEHSPNECVKNNVFGTLNLVKAAARHNVEKFVLISSDKAVNPTNIMGASKRICEMIVQSYNRKSTTDFVAVRFGNVLGSNGSVVPVFQKQIEQGGPVGVTHPEITRYFMTISEAVSLVLQAGAYARGGEIFVLDMGRPVKILDVAENLIRLSGLVPNKDIDIEFTGLRPGEKLYEELLMDDEDLRETQNRSIYIARPIEFDEKWLFRVLDEIFLQMSNESYDLRENVRKLVPTYADNSIDRDNEHIIRCDAKGLQVIAV